MRLYTSFRQREVLCRSFFYTKTTWNPSKVELKKSCIVRYVHYNNPYEAHYAQLRMPLHIYFIITLSALRNNIWTSSEIYGNYCRIKKTTTRVKAIQHRPLRNSTANQKMRDLYYLQSHINGQFWILHYLMIAYLSSFTNYKISIEDP